MTILNEVEPKTAQRTAAELAAEIREGIAAEQFLLDVPVSALPEDAPNEDERTGADADDGSGSGPDEQERF